MNVLLSLLIVAVNPDAPIEERYPGAAEIFHCPFDAPWDKNFDDWPDEWSRRRGRGFPHYVTIRICDDPTPAGSRCLRIDLDGGAAVAYSPVIRVTPLYTYVLEGWLQTEGLQHDEACFSLTLLNKKQRPLETHRSEKIQGSRGWKKLRLGPITPGNDNTCFAVVGLHLEPGSRADLTGSARFGDVWLGRLPRISLAANSVHHVFTDPEGVKITCNASGFPRKDPPVVFRLEDAFGARIAEERRHLKTTLALEDDELSPEDASDQPPCLIGSARWRPPVPGPGFYRVRVTMHGQDELVHERELTLAVIQENLGHPGNEFGWSLPQGDKPLPLAELSQLIGQAGIGWVKYPLWYDVKTSDEQIEELAQFCARLAVQGIQLVGLLHDPPESLRARFEDLGTPAEIFTADPKLWYPSLESVMNRIGTRVQWWQLGHDTDQGFVGYPKLSEKTAQIKAQLDRLSHDVNVGFGWGWMHQLPEAADGKPPWRFLALSADPPLTHQELSTYLSAARQDQVRRWVVLEPLSGGRYSLSARVADLVWRMMSARIHGAEGVFIPDPFSTDHGLMNDDGTAGELLLPWRTAALMLGGATYLGSIQLPQGSRNHVFARFDDAVMLVWNNKPTEEVIHLGPDLRQVDLWGRTAVPRTQGDRHVIEVGPLPTFVAGIDPGIIRWRQSVCLDSRRIPNVAGMRHQNRLRLKNSFEKGLSGHLALVLPDTWQVSPQRTEFRLAPGEPLVEDFQITLPSRAESGRHTIRVDFELEADGTRRFSAYRHVDVGSDDVYIEVVTLLNDRGELEVEQHLVNDTGAPISFRCQLLAPNRRRQTARIIGLGQGRNVSTYRLPDGEQLTGKTLWLRAEQIGGPRVLNYRFVAEG